MRPAGQGVSASRGVTTPGELLPVAMSTSREAPRRANRQTVWTVSFRSANPAAMAPSALLRRSQAERRVSTRAAVLEATLACLIERGYARTTTAEIERRARVSRGARLHHFPTKAGLMAAAVVQLFERVGARHADAMSRLSPDPDPDRFREACRLLWDVYEDESYAAVLELFVASRHDAELRQALRDTSTGLHREVRRMANTCFPILAHRDADGLLESLQALMAGLALHRFVFRDDGTGRRRVEDRVLDLVERMVGRAFDLPPKESR